MIDHDIGTDVADQVDLRLPAGHGDRPRTGGLRELDGCGSCAARGTGDQDRFARLQMRTVVQGIQRRAVVDRDRRRSLGRYPVGHCEHTCRRVSHLLGESTAAEERNALSDFHPGDALAERCDSAARFAARRVAWTSLHLVLAAALQHIGKRQTDRFDVDQHLARPG